MIGVYQDNMCSSDNKRSWLCALPVSLHSKGSFEGPPTANARQGHVNQKGLAAICHWENVESLKCIQQCKKKKKMLVRDTTQIIRRHVFSSLLRLLIAKVYELNWKLERQGGTGRGGG